MEGHVRKRGEKWYYSFEASNVEGKRKRIERVGGRTKKEAEAALRLALQEYNNAGLHFEPSDISVSDYMDYWYKNYVELNCKYNTRIGYRMIIEKHVKPTIGNYKLKALIPPVLQEFVNNKYITGYSKSHITNMMTVLSGSFSYAVYPCKFIKENPMQYVKYPRYDQKKVDIDNSIISRIDFQLIIERFPINTPYYAPLMIGYYTGCRIGEVMALTWDDINLDTGMISINKILYKREKDWYFGTTKTKSSERTVEIGETLISTLKKVRIKQLENNFTYGAHYLSQYEFKERINNEELRHIYTLPTIIPTEMRKIDFVCTKENGEMVTPETFKYASRVIHYSMGITFNFHALRHTHATTLIENGAGIKDVQERLGHAFVQTTLDKYTHTTKKSSKQTVEIYEKAVNQDLPTKIK
jgi:integrase